MTASNSIDRSDLPIKLPSEIAEYLEQQNLILEYLRKARAKSQIALSDDFLDYNPEIIHHYLWSLCGRLEIITRMFEGLIDILFSI